MTDTTRRGFLAVAGVGAAGIAAAAVVGSGPGSAAQTPTTDLKGSTELPSGISGGLVAYVHDVSNGLVSVMVGEREVIIRDKALVARLANAATK